MSQSPDKADSTSSAMIEAEAGDGTPANERSFEGWLHWLFYALCVIYAGWHLYVLNIAPLETWTFRILHVAGALGLGFALIPAGGIAGTHEDQSRARPIWLGSLLAAALVGYAAVITIAMFIKFTMTGDPQPPAALIAGFGPCLAVGTVIAVVLGWITPSGKDSIKLSDLVLVAASLTVAGFILFSLDNLGLRLRAGTAFADPHNAWASAVGVLLILELTRRLAGMALVVIALVFVVYSFVGPFLPGFLEHKGYTAARFFSYIYTDNGILGPTIAVSSTYIILFITFAAFLQASKVGDYFVNFAFAAAGRARGGPAKVAVFASGLMGMINGTSAGNVVATGSLTIPLMKKVGYRPQSAGAIEAAASTGGQIMPPIMGAGAFIMAEVTGIPYTEIVVAALIPAILYFVSIYIMVDLEAVKTGMRGMTSDELPKLKELAKQAFLFIPIIILIYALFSGYSVIRAGTLAIVSAIVVSWLTPYRVGIKRLLEALSLSTRMSLQIIAVCAAAGIIVGVISLTGVGARFSGLLLGLAEHSQLLALVFAMCIAIILGMGMPTTAAYAVAASVVAPGLIQLGITPLVAHFFVFYYAVISAITPPVALAAYAGGAIAGADPMRTSVTSFLIGLAAFIVPYMFFYSPALLLVGDWLTIARVFCTALLGVYLLASAVQGWFVIRASWPVRGLLLIGALCMISGDWRTDLAGLTIAGGLFLLRRVQLKGTATAAAG
ncbi:MAG: TRAP transporter permease [Geminicoccaceae bacterium]